MRIDFRTAATTARLLFRAVGEFSELRSRIDVSKLEAIESIRSELSVHMPDLAEEYLDDLARSIASRLLHDHPASS